MRVGAAAAVGATALLVTLAGTAHAGTRGDVAGGAAAATAPPILAMGLIPVEALGALSVVHESFVVSPRQDGCEVRREVKIRCRGGTGTYRVAIPLRAPDGSVAGLDSTIAMSLDDIAQDLLIYEDGYEAGPGTWAVA